MGLKSGRRTFTGTLKAAILSALRAGGGMSKKQLLARVRKQPDLKASVTKLTTGIRQLIGDGKIVQVGKRAKARFKRA